jgi:hypothetical protein
MKTMRVSAELFSLAARFVSHPKMKRTLLEGVFIQPGKFLSSRIFASDGHRLIVFDDTTISAERFPIIIRPEKILMSVCKSAGTDAYLEISEGGSVEVRESNETLLYRSFTSILIDVVPISYEQVIPEKFSWKEYQHPVVEVDARYLYDFALSRDAVRIIPAGGPSGPIVVTNPDYPNMLGILMPRRSDDILPDLDMWRNVAPKEETEEGVQDESIAGS